METNKEAVIISNKILYYSNVYNQNIIMYPDYLYNYIENIKEIWDIEICNEIVLANLKELFTLLNQLTMLLLMVCPGTSALIWVKNKFRFNVISHHFVTGILSVNSNP